MGAGFGMMMPGMIQQAMAGGHQAPPPGQPPPQSRQGPQPPKPSPTAGGGLDFGELAPVTTDPKSMVRSVVTAAAYKLEEAGDSWHITIPIDTLRKQRVTVEFGGTDEAGHPIVAYWSICGPALEKNAMALLRYNTKMLHGAFAARQVEGTEMVVLQANQLAETLDPLEVSRVLSAIAWQADKVEQKLVGGDKY
jgi:hypothetical protein